MLSRLEIEKKPGLQFVLILCLCLISVILFSIVGGVITLMVYGLDVSNINNLDDPNTIAGMKLLQLFSAIGLFVAPPIIYGLIVSKTPIQQLSLTRLGKPINYLLVLLVMIGSMPFLSWIIEINSSMVLPDFLSGVEQWMRDSENQAELLTEAFLTYDGLGSLFYVLIIVAVVPALGEELLFRGVLQKILIKGFNNPHLGIWITAFAFSALHMQFFGFFPRMLLGVLFGYVFFWSKSLWLPIVGHFINNGTVVVSSYFFPEMVSNADISIFGDSENSFVFYLLSVVVSSSILYLMWKLNAKKIDQPL